MKPLLNHATRIVALVIFAILIVSFILTLRRGLEASPGETQAESYPGENAAVLDPYAAYAPQTPVDTGEEDVCTGFGEWVTYINSEAGYSLQYPAESKLKEYREYITISLRPDCYGQQCGSFNKVTVGVRENPQRLPIEAFVEQEFELNETASWDNSQYIQNFQNGQFVTIAGVEALYIEDGVSLGKPDFFIPHEDGVIWINVATAGIMPPHDPPCTQTLELLDGILASIELLPPQQ